MMLILVQLPSHATAGRIDYTRFNDREFFIVSLVTILILLVFLILAVIGWIRYKKKYTPAPGVFSPNQVLFIICGLVLGAVVFALYQAGVL